MIKTTRTIYRPTGDMACVKGEGSLYLSGRGTTGVYIGATVAWCFNCPLTTVLRTRQMLLKGVH